MGAHGGSANPQNISHLAKKFSTPPSQKVNTHWNIYDKGPLSETCYYIRNFATILMGSFQIILVYLYYTTYTGPLVINDSTMKPKQVLQPT